MRENLYYFQILQESLSKIENSVKGIHPAPADFAKNLTGFIIECSCRLQVLITFD